MSEADSISALSGTPNSVTSLVRDFKALGLEAGMNVLVHSSLSSLGWVCGGAPAVVLALEEVLEKSGTLVMPAHSGDLSNPAFWEHPPVPESWWQIIRDEMPAFDRWLTPTRGMGAIAETFQKQEGVLRSGHPQSSFSARGKHKEYILKDDRLSYQMNDESPLGRLYQLDGHILLLGVGWDNITSAPFGRIPRFLERKAHHFEPRTRYGKRSTRLEGNGRHQLRRRGILVDGSGLRRVVRGIGDCRNGMVGRAIAKLVNQRALVDFSVEWIEKNRKNT